MPKTVNSTVALQGGFLKHLGDTVLLDLVCLSLLCHFRQTDDDQIRLCVENKNLTGLFKIQFEIIYIALFTIQSLQSSFTGN